MRTRKKPFYPSCHWQAPPPQLQLDLDYRALRARCESLELEKLWLFGSVLKPTFHDKSDVDVMVRYLPEAPSHVFHVMKTLDKLTDLLGRKVDLVLQQNIENEMRTGGPEEQACCEDILSLAVPVYVTQSVIESVAS
jgi:predicted nucleotidyltransferase